LAVLILPLAVLLLTHGAKPDAQQPIEDQLRRGCEQLLGVVPIEISPIGDRAEWSRFRRQRRGK